MIAMSNHQIYYEENFPHGLRCARCMREFVEGEAINSEFHSFTDAIPEEALEFVDIEKDTINGFVPICILTCMGCAVRSAEGFPGDAE